MQAYWAEPLDNGTDGFFGGIRQKIVAGIDRAHLRLRNRGPEALDFLGGVVSRCEHEQNWESSPGQCRMCRARLLPEQAVEGGRRGTTIRAGDDRAVLLLHPGTEALLQRRAPARSLLARRSDKPVPVIEAIAHVLLRDLPEHVLEAPVRVARDVGVACVEEDERL